MKNSIKAILFIAILGMKALTASAQGIEITGKVSDSKGEPLPGATVIIKEISSIGTTTNPDGTYSLKIPTSTFLNPNLAGMSRSDLHIQAKYVGYLTSQKRIDSNRVDFKLEEDAIGLEQVVVTGTRTKKLLKDAPVITRVITEEDIKKVDATNIGDLLQSELPGVEFSYSMNQQVSLNMQGFGGTTVLFLVDGERLAGETMDNVDYQRLNLDNVGRIEIVKGAASSLYGSNAVGGVVNIISKESTEPWTANINGLLGDHSEQRYGGTVSFNAGKIYNVLNVQHTRKDQIDLENDGDYSTIYGYYTWNFKDRLVWNVADNLKLTARAGYFFKQREYSVDEKNRYRDFSGGLKANWQISDNDDLELAYSFDQYDKSDYYPTTTGYDLKDYSNVQHSGRVLYNHTFAEGLILTGGADVMRDYLMSYQFEDNGTEEQYTADVFAQIDWNITDKLNLIAGARFDYYSEADVRNLSPKIGLMYKFRRFNLRGSYSGGFRAPTLKEMYMNYDMASIFMLYGNEDLEPETSHNFQLSGEYNKGGYSATLTGYYNIVDDRITSVWDQSRYGMVYSNIQKMKIYGLEANGQMRLSCGFGARLSYCWCHEKLKKGDMYQSYVSTTRPHTLTCRVEYGKKKDNHSYNIAISGRYLSAVDTFEYSAYVQDDTGTVPTEEVHYPGYAIWKLMISNTFAKGITITASLDNLLDYVPSYYYSNSPYTTGRTLSVSMSLDIDQIIK